MIGGTSEEMQWYRTFPAYEYEGIVCALSRHGSDVLYSISSSSVQLMGDKVAGNEETTAVNDDDPEETIDLDGLSITRQEFYEFIEGSSTCYICGLDLEFVDGHIMDNEGNFICHDCTGLEMVQKYINQK